PVSGTSWPASGRLQVAAESRQTGLMGYSNAGGRFGPYIKYAGFDAIVVRGRSERPVYLYVEDGRAELRDASYLWGLDTWAAEDALREEHGEEARVACIGQAGENLVRYAAIITEKGRAAARTGLGAVMGAKRLKAVVLSGTMGVTVARPREFEEFVEWAAEQIDADRYSETYKDLGTPLLVVLMNLIGRLPTKNHWTGHWERAEEISGERIVWGYRVAKRACFSCRFHCKNVLRLGDTLGDHPEYETIDALGANLLIDDPEFIIRANWLADRYGIDTISLGGTIAWAVECYERGLLTREDTGGLELRWGDPELVEELIHMIAHRRGFGDLLAEGSARASRRVGRGTERYAMHVKGLEIPAQDGRAQKSMGLAHATAARGADHLTHSTFLDEVGFEEAIIKRYGEKYLPEMADRLSPRYKGVMAKDCEDLVAAASSMVLCVTGGWLHPPLFYWPELARLYTLVTGVEASEEDMRRVGERIVNLRRAYLIKHGVGRRDDSLPERFTREPAPTGPNRGQVVELDQMLDEYYRARGWDLETGWIPRSKLEELGLEDVADELEEMGRLPG
ncbi:MAG: aldehyde ferredoxin oxidoreductase, partial [Thermoproteota archaeon]